MENRLLKILDDVGDLIHNGVNKDSASISEDNLCRLGLNMRNLIGPNGVDEIQLSKLELLIKIIYKEYKR